MVQRNKLQSKSRLRRGSGLSCAGRRAALHTPGQRRKAGFWTLSPWKYSYI